jgi:hypothetical protein
MIYFEMMDCLKLIQAKIALKFLILGDSIVFLEKIFDEPNVKDPSPKTLFLFDFP